MQYPVLNKDSIKANITETKAKIPLLLKGNWHVPGFGLMSVTDEYINKLTDNFNSNVLGFVPYATLGHLTDSPDPASIDGERKRGDLKELIKEGDVVYGIYDINAETYNLIKNGEYEYSSPEIQQNFRDKVTGELKGPTLLRTALTNAPFMPFNENKIVTLSQGDNSNTNTAIYIKLSTNIDNIEEPIESLKVEPVTIITEQIETTTDPVKEQVQDIITMPTINDQVVVSTPEVKETTNQVNTNTIDLEAILNKVIATQQASLTSTIEAVTSRFNESLEAVNNKTAETIASIVTKVEELANQVSTVVTKSDEIDKTTQYITALSSSEKAREMNSKLNSLFREHNVNPAALSLAKSIMTKNTNSVIKLSVNGNDTDVSLEDSIIELIKLSSNVVPTETQIGGQVTAPKASYINSVIEANNAKAKAKREAK